MFARGAMANPAIFRQYHALRKTPERARRGGAFPDAGEAGAADALGREELLALILRHAELARELTPGKPGRRGYPPALLKMRTVVPRYARHLPGVKRLRLALANCESWEELDDILRRFFSEESESRPAASPGGAPAATTTHQA